MLVLGCLVLTCDPMVIPQTQIKQAPEVGAPIALFSRMLIRQTPDKFIVKKTAFTDRRVQELLHQTFAFGAAEPLACRRAKSALRLIEHVMGKHRFQRSLKNMLS